MVFVRKIHSFGANRDKMVDLWVTYCRSVLEQSAVLWQGGLTLENRKSLERTQKSFAKLILKRRYTNYEQALSTLKLEKLDRRRDQLCLKFARKCLTNKKTAHMFPLSKEKHTYSMRKIRKYNIHQANTERMKKSPIVYMQTFLNKHHED